MKETMFEFVLPDYFIQVLNDLYLFSKIMLQESTSNPSTACSITTKIPWPYIVSRRFGGKIKPFFFRSQKCFKVAGIFICFKKLVSPAKNVKGNTDWETASTHLFIRTCWSQSWFYCNQKAFTQAVTSCSTIQQTNFTKSKRLQKNSAVVGQKRTDRTITPAASPTTNKSAYFDYNFNEAHRKKICSNRWDEYKNIEKI